MISKFNSSDFSGFGVEILLLVSIMTKERSVAATARQLGIGSSAVSMSLQRLRTAVRDPLFVRSKSGMIPTSRALELAGLIDPFLTQLRVSLSSSEVFDPRTVDRKVHLALADDLEATFLPDFLADLADEAPGLQIVVHDANYQQIDAILASGRVDMVMSAILNEYPARSPYSILYRDHFVAVFSKEKTGYKLPITLKEYVETPQILVSPNGDTTGPIDRILEGLGVARYVHTVTTKFSNIPSVLCKNNLLCNIPSRSAEAFARIWDLRVCALPFTSPEINVGIAWQSVLERDPMTNWLKKKIEMQVERSSSRVSKQSST